MATKRFCDMCGIPLDRPGFAKCIIQFGRSWGQDGIAEQERFDLELCEYHREDVLGHVRDLIERDESNN